MNTKIIISVILSLCLFFYLFFILNVNNNDVFYIENFLDESDFEHISNYTKKIKNFKNETFRLVNILNNKKIEDILYSPSIISKLEKKVNKKLYKSNFPIEFRIYPTKSPGMKCHSDLLMYEKPQYEAVLTIDNNSDSYTEWYDYNNKKHKIYTKPNSLILVRAKGNIHCVSPINYGSRSIIKYIYTQTSLINNNYKQEMLRFK